MPRSASTSMTSRPRAAIDTARFVETVVLPTPPLPPVTASTLTGRVAFSRASCSILLRGNWLCMCLPSSEVTREIGLIAPRRDPVSKQHRGPNHPDAVLEGRVQVIGHALAVAQISDRQSVPQCGRHRRAEARGLVDLRQDAG